MYKSLHPKADGDRLYWKMENGGKGLISLEECERIEKKFRFLSQRTRTINRSGNWSNVITTQSLQQHKENYAQKGICSAFMRVTEEVRDNNCWLWMKKGDLKKDSEGLIMVAKDKSLQTGRVKTR